MNGTASLAGATFQTGDTINGTANGNNALNITQASGGANAVTATVNNVGNVNVKAVGAAGTSTTYNTALWSNVGNVTITQGVGVGGGAAGADSVFVTNGAASTVYGIASATGENMTVSFTPGASNQTFQVALAGAGGSTAATAATIDYVGANADINAINVAGVGTNNISLNGTTNVKTITITGAGKNTIALTANAVSQTAAVTIDASAATGNQVIDLGTNLSVGGVTVKGTTDASTTTLGLVIPAAATLPTITNVDALQIDAGSNGTLISATANTSITSLSILDTAAAANANAYNLVGFNGVNAVNFGVTGGQNNFFGALTVTGTGALAETFSNTAAAALASTNNLTLGAQVLNGYSSLTVTTAGGLGSAGTFTQGNVTSNSLTSYTLVDASTGATNLNTITSTNAAGAGTLSSINLGGVAGANTLNIGLDTLAASSVITGSVGIENITFAGGGAGTQAGATTLSVTLGNANNIFSEAGLAAVTALNTVVTAGSGNNTIVTRAGNDVITVGAGANNITVGAGSNVVTLGAGHLAAGNVNTVALGSTANTVNGWALDTAGVNADRLDVTNAALTGAAEANKAIAATTFANGVATNVELSATGVVTFETAGNVAITLTAADAAAAQAALVAAVGGAAWATANQTNIFVAGTNTYVNDWTGVALTNAVTLVGVTGTGVDVVGGGATLAGYVSIT